LQQQKKKKVDSIFAVDLNKSTISLQKEKTELTLRPYSALSDNSSLGRPIDIHTATVSLKFICKKFKIFKVNSN
jgi:hypothetical protein